MTDPTLQNERPQQTHRLSVSLVLDKLRRATSLVARGVISPLLANLYPHWFGKLFHRADGPAQWANAKLVRYADDCAPRARRPEEGLTWVTA